MLYALLSTAFFVVCLLLILLILIQRGSGSMGLGTMGGGTQMLFGGSGGQDVFQKVTWVLAAVFMLFSLVLGIMKNQQARESRYLDQMARQLPVDQLPMPPVSGE